jgi:8-oxo-dGTP diphosphatase
MTTVDRHAVRIVCLDPAGRVLLMHWRDPVTGNTLWEPPGGGVEPGESELAAARRELHEETGLDPAVVTLHSTRVPRDLHWAGQHIVTTETFFLARLPTAALPGPAALTEGEQSWLLDQAFFPPSALPPFLEPPTLPAVITALTTT